MSKDNKSVLTPEALIGRKIKGWKRIPGFDKYDAHVDGSPNKRKTKIAQWENEIMLVNKLKTE